MWETVLSSLDIGIPGPVFISKAHRYSILPALSLDEIIAIEVLDRPFTAATFNKFIEGLLDQMNPWPQRNSVIVMDNASIHKFEELELMIKNRYVTEHIGLKKKILTCVGIRGMHLVFLPAYSPDLNPIEEAFSAIKAWIRRNR